MGATQVVGGTNTQREFNMGLEEKFLDTLYQMHQPNQEFQASYKTMAEKTGIPANIVGNVIQFLEDNNLLTRRFQWNSNEGGRQAYWTIRTDHQHAATLLKRFHIALTEGKLKRSDIQHRGNPWQNDKRGGRPSRNNGQAEQIGLPIETESMVTNAEAQKSTVIRDVNLPDEVNAAKAVVDNVRSYINAQQLAKTNLAQLRAAGMNVNEEAYFASIQMTPNTEADAIALVMPYIEFCESRIANLRK